jgi:hypothetical protein
LGEVRPPIVLSKSSDYNFYVSRFFYNQYPQPFSD